MDRGQPGWLQSKGLQSVKHDWTTEQQQGENSEKQENQPT